MGKYLFCMCGMLFFAAFCNPALAENAGKNLPAEPKADNMNKASAAAASASVKDAIDMLGGKEAKTQEDSIEALEQRASNGDIEAMLDLGYMYLYGEKGAHTDYQKALFYYEQAATSNNAIALNNLGSLYFNGIGTPVNHTKAIALFEEAAKQGSEDAAVNLAIIYLGAGKKSKDGEENLNKAITLLKQAQKTNSIAKYLLGYAYAKGFLVKQSDKEAFTLIKAAADDNYDEAQLVLADFYINGRGTPKNYSKAVRYLNLSAAQGNLAAIMQLADILSEGKIYTRDIKKAHILYNVAAVMNVDEAAQKRDELEKDLKIEDLLAVQAEAENYQQVPSEKTSFIRKTYGKSLKIYIDKNLKKKK